LKANSVILSVLGAGAVVGVAICVAVERQARLRVGEENKALRQQLDQMASLVEENERLSNLVAQASRSQSRPDERLEAQSLSDEQSLELLRLRGEVGALREQSKELETLREENRQVRAALGSGHKAQNAGQAATADKGAASKESQFQILRAEYWTQNARLDVTEELRERILEDKLKAIASNNIKGDPEFGQTKRLTIEYSFAGVTMTNEFREGDLVIIPGE
jgi:outer membrane translocation and assembly module TamA